MLGGATVIPPELAAPRSGDSMPYSAVTQPLRVARDDGGHALLHRAARGTLLAPKVMVTAPSAQLPSTGSILSWRIWSGQRLLPNPMDPANSGEVPDDGSCYGGNSFCDHRVTR